MSYTNGLDKPTDYFNTVLYTGDGTSGRTISGVGFQSDFLWIKSRSNATNHSLTDVIRGGDLQLRSNTTDAESQFGSQDITFTSDGFTNAGSTSNNSGYTFVAWNWLAGGTASSNTDGSITSSVSANTTSGFSIVSFVGNATSGATVGHGLGVAPKVVIIKGRDSALGWRSYFAPLGATKYLELDSTAGEASNTNFMNDTAPTNQVFYLGNGTTPNKNGENYIAYCFSEKKGFSKFGSYTGNGSTDGTFVYTGFKPAWIMFKRTDSANSWPIEDTKRDTFNPADKRVWAEATDGETENGNGLTDFLSNGFKIRQSTTQFNASGGTYIYMAFAESPFVTSTGIPTVAR